MASPELPFGMTEEELLTENLKPTSFINQYYHAASRGDLSDMPQLADSLSTDLDHYYYQKFKDRFIDQVDGMDLATMPDPLLREVASLYQDYWRDTLLSPDQRVQHEQRLTEARASLLTGHNIDTTIEGAEAVVQQTLEDRGFGVLMGRTPPLLTFFVWATTHTQQYDVDLTDAMQAITVNVLEDYLCLDWFSYATFDNLATGGWATKEAVFSVGNDPQSEIFTVSLLKHEARHFADYALFPQLQGADLEYRAKLTELAFAEERLYELLEVFMSGAEETSHFPHPIANWHVTTHLSKLLLGTPWPHGDNPWSSLSIDAIHSAARDLLDRNTRALRDESYQFTQPVLGSG
ncbi:MAG: hypothetical protein AAF525_00720 [Pseudomonadota bacterium]